MKFEAAEKWFNTYVSNFDSGTGRNNPIRLKIDHSRIVAREIEDIAQKNGITGDELVLAKTIGLLHDIGRFEQYSKHKTLHDVASANHAHIGVEVLKKESVLDEFSNEHRNIILKAIAFHNAKFIPKGLSEKENYFTKLIRDADKIDIFRVVIDYYKNMKNERSEVIELSLPDSPGFTEAIINDLLAKRTADYKQLKTLNDFKLLQIGWVYDINFTRTFEIVNEKKYIDRIYEFLPKNESAARIYHDAKEYVKGKIFTVTSEQ